MAGLAIIEHLEQQVLVFVTNLDNAFYNIQTVVYRPSVTRLAPKVDAKTRGMWQAYRLIRAYLRARYIQ